MTYNTKPKINAPVGVAGERGDLGHGRVAPQDDLVQAVTVRAHDLVHRPGPHEVAHLRVS